MLDFKSVLFFTSKKGPLQIDLQCLPVGRDFQVFITGGAEHVGATAIGVCYDRDGGGSNASTIAVSGHREDELAGSVARRLSRALKTTVAVTAGIHFENLAKEDIEEILSLVDQLTERLINRLQ